MLAESVAAVLNDITKTALSCNRDPESVTLVAVSKTHPAQAVNAAIEAGIMHLGENRLQEAEGKIQQVDGKATWHLVGHLQSNKAKRAAELFDWIDSVDSLKVAEILSKRAEELNKTLNVLIQVNISGEDVKSGIEPDETTGLISEVSRMPGLNLRGLMTIGSLSSSEKVTEKEFAKMSLLFEMIKKETGLPLDTLSMGMSGDYRIAIREGATMVRIGSAIFGTRE